MMMMIENTFCHSLKGWCKNGCILVAVNLVTLFEIITTGCKKCQLLYLYSYS